MNDRKLKFALFADLELTCWEGGTPPAGEQPEIIEVGIAELDLESFAIRRTFRRLIKPRFSKVSPYCEALTGISPKDAKSGRPYAEVASSTHKAFGSTPWYAWGSDGEALHADAIANNCLPLLTGPQSDLSLVFNQAIGLGKKNALADALALMGLDFEGRQHSALDDAINTARLFAAIATRLRTMPTI